MEKNALNLLYNEAEKLNISISDEQLEKFNIYCDMLLEYNEKVNLTAILEHNDIAIKHFLDSLTFLKYVNVKENASLIDVGTGAGFPSIPISIMKNDVNVTMLDSLNKRVNFLKEVSETLKLNAKAIHFRAEIAGVDTEYREKFDIATARAVANLSVLSEYCLPFVKVGGYFVAMKGKNIDDEINESKKAIEMLGGEIESINNFSLNVDNTRNIVIIKKIKSTDKKYPRQRIKITKNPLN